MSDLPTVVSDCELSNSFLSETIQVCIVSRDHKRIMEGMVRLGIGPWRVYHYVDALDIRETEYRGAPEDFKMTLCLAWNGAMLWEIVEPLEGGRTIYDDFLDEHGEGIHHVAFMGGEADGEEMPYDDQIAEFARTVEGKFHIYSGNDSDTFLVLALGGVGVISVQSHLVSGETRRLINSFVEGDQEAARRQHFRLLPIARALFPTGWPNPVAVKAALNMSGFEVGKPRLPLVELPDDMCSVLRQVVKSYELDAFLEPVAVSV